MSNQSPVGVRRHHVSLTPTVAATLERLVDHLAAEHPNRRVTASAAMRFAIVRTASAFESVAVL